MANHFNDKQQKEENLMTHTYTALIQQRGAWWVGRIQEIPSVNCQERTRDELLDTLKITLGEMLEINEKEAISLVENGYQAVAIQI
ncbi:MAG: type II toxin-antitoxin system HicB family antitoxin [Candidatus Poribacteria bacterium]|nr:type II toxin-antitoxin system HicB family antitoxin [Candidatus Poribacteria bacterium]